MSRPWSRRRSPEPDALTEATVQWLAFGAAPRPRAFPLEHRVCNLFWSHEMWNWSPDQTMAAYTRHKAAVDELARAAGLARPSCVDAIARDREQQAALQRWLHRDE